MILDQTWEPCAKEPNGLPNRPFYISRIKYSEDGRFTRIDVRSIPANRFVTVGPGGVLLEEDEDGEGDISVLRFCADLNPPRDGWRVESVRSDQTGGFCMVDVVRFENGFVVAITDEVVAAFESHDEYLEDEDSAPYFLLDDDDAEKFGERS